MIKDNVLALNTSTSLKTTLADAAAADNEENRATVLGNLCIIK
jgi:hypothetical protein